MEHLADQATQQDPSIDIFVIVKAMLRAAVWALPLAVIAALGAYYYFSQQDPVYNADGAVLIDVPTTVNLRGTSEMAGPDISLRLSQESINSKVQVIRSRDLAKSVINNLGLESIKEFQPDTDKSMLGNPAIKADPRVLKETVISKFDEKLVVYAVDQSRVIVVEFESNDPDLAANITNNIMDTFLATEQVSKQQSASDARVWLEKEITNLRRRVVAAESAAEQYRSRKGLFSTSTDTTLPEQELANLSQALSDARTRNNAAQSALTGLEAVFARANGNASVLLSVPAVANSPLVQTLRQNKAQLEAQIADLSADLLPRHPRLRALVVQLDELDRQIANEAKSVLTGARQEAERAAKEIVQLQQQLSAQKLATGTANESEVELRALEREARAERDLLETLLAQYRTSLAREGAGGLLAEARIIARAQAPIEPTGPKVVILTAAVSLAVLMLVMGFVVLRELLNGRALGIRRDKKAAATVTHPHAMAA